MAGRPKKRLKKKLEAIANLPAVIPQPEPEPEPTDRWGRPTKFKPEYVEIVRTLCIEGHTDQEIAEFLGVCRKTLHNWRIGHPELAEEMKLGKALADDRLERASFELALGYTVTVKKHMKVRDQYGNEKLEEYEEEIHVPPSGEQLRWMLQNRRSDSWKSKTEQHNIGTIEHIHLTADQAKERLAARLQALKDQRQ